jgi:hypothetical protein
MGQPTAVTRGNSSRRCFDLDLRTRQIRLFILAALLTSCFEPFSGNALAQGILGAAEPEIATSPDMTRTEWRERVAEAKRRAREFGLERRRHPIFDPSDIIDDGRMASERVLNDESLQTGDIVSTNRGLFVFRGRPDGERSERDFVLMKRR